MRQIDSYAPGVLVGESNVAQDYLYRVSSTTNVIGRPPSLVRGSDLRAGGAKFASVYAVTAHDAAAIQHAAQTAAGFKGTVWSHRLWIDFDTYEAAITAESWLKEQGYDYVSYDTGGRGRHVGVLRDARPSHTLPEQDKRWVEANIRGADLSLYWHLHLIRLPGTVHDRTGKQKHLHSTNAGRAIVLTPLLAGGPAEGVGRLQREDEGTSSSESVFSKFEVLQLLQGCDPEGRHKHLVKLAFALRLHSGGGLDEAVWVLGEVNKQFPEGPKEEAEVRRIAEWAFSQGVDHARR